MQRRFDVVIVHGTGGSPEGNWFPWLRSELEARGHAVVVPRFPTPEGQSLANWLATFRRAVPVLGASSVLIGHSLGVGFLLSVLSEAPSPVAATFFAAGFLGALGNEAFDPLNASFFDGRFDWQLIRDRAGAVFQYAGSDDPYVPIAKSEEIARHLGGKLTVIPEGGHLNAESGFTRFDRLLGDFGHWAAGHSSGGPL